MFTIAEFEIVAEKKASAPLVCGCLTAQHQKLKLTFQSLRRDLDDLAGAVVVSDRIGTSESPG